MIKVERGSDSPPLEENSGSNAVATGLPELSYLKTGFQEAIAQFYPTVSRIIDDNPVDAAALVSLSKKAAQASLSDDETAQLGQLKLQALAQGRAVGAVLGFFLKFNPYSMLAEVRKKEAVFQPVFGPVLVVEGDAVRDVLSRHGEFTVDPYGAEMRKSMSPEFNGGFDTFILSTDDDAKYVEDKLLLTSVVRQEDAATIVDLIRNESSRRIQQAIAEAKSAGNTRLDVVTTLARFIPVVLGHHYLGVPVYEQRGSFTLTEDMLAYYGKRVAGPDGTTPLPLEVAGADGTAVSLPDSALGKDDGVIPDEQTVYRWIVAAFQHFFNNVQKDIAVQAHGVRAYRELLVYLLREVDIQRQALQSDPDNVGDNMLTRLVRVQLGLLTIDGVSADRVSDLRIAENVMGTMVGAVAGQEEATCRVLDSIMRLADGEFDDVTGLNLTDSQSPGTFEEVRNLAHQTLDGNADEACRKKIAQYVDEAMRLQPQGEVLLRLCVKEGAVIANSGPIRAGTLVFAAHGSAMQDIEASSSFILGRDQSHYLQFGYGRHKCLGQFVSPVLMREAMIALLGLQNVRRPQPEPGQTAFPRERRLGRFQLDDNNLYAQSFILEFDDSGSTHQYFSEEAPC